MRLPTPSSFELALDLPPPGSQLLLFLVFSTSPPSAEDGRAVAGGPEATLGASTEIWRTFGGWAELLRPRAGEGETGRRRLAWSLAVPGG